MLRVDIPKHAFMVRLDLHLFDVTSQDSAISAFAMVVLATIALAAGCIPARAVKQVEASLPVVEFASFADRVSQSLYRDRALAMLSLCFAGLASILCAIGVFGLTSYSIAGRTKEIGVRKVLGASIPEIVNMISWDFLKWVLAANVFAWPVAWFAMNRWLLDFSYRIKINLWMFVVSGTLTLMIALLTVGCQALRAATANPVESLKYE